MLWYGQQDFNPTNELVAAVCLHQRKSYVHNAKYGHEEFNSKNEHGVHVQEELSLKLKLPLKYNL
jgi:hypothetical protein